MPQTYRDFTELVLHAAKDRDYRLNIVDRRADVTITAVHGGSIEPLTSWGVSFCACPSSVLARRSCMP